MVNCQRMSGQRSAATRANEATQMQQSEHLRKEEEAKQQCVVLKQRLSELVNELAEEKTKMAEATQLQQSEYLRLDEEAKQQCKLLNLSKL